VPRLSLLNVSPPCLVAERPLQKLPPSLVKEEDSLLPVLREAEAMVAMLGFFRGDERAEGLRPPMVGSLGGVF